MKIHLLFLSGFTVLLVTTLLVTTMVLGDEPFSKSDPFGGGGAFSKGVKRLGQPTPTEGTKASEAYKRIEAELNCSTSVSLEKIPLAQAMQAISTAHSIPIAVDKHSLFAKGIDPNAPVSIHLTGVKLRSVLKLMFRDMDLDYVIKDETLQIKTKDDVEREAVILIYALDSYDERSEDLASTIQKSLDAKHSDPMPRPVVQLIRNADPKIKRYDIFVEANKSMHAQVHRILAAFASNTP